MATQTVVPAEVATSRWAALARRAGFIAREPLLFAVCALALWLRLWGLSFCLPYACHPDEPVVYGTVVHMLRDHTLNPGTFTYPSALYYFLGAIGLVYQAVTGTALTATPNSLGVDLYPNPGAVLWMRVGVALIGVAAVALVYLTARRFVGPLAAAAGALLLAVAPLHINLSQLATTDGPSAAALALAALLSVVAARRQTVRSYLFAGAAVGVAAGVKYNVAAGAAMLVAAYGYGLWRRAREGERPTWRALLRDPRLLGFAAIAVGFLVTTPFALLDARTFLRDVRDIYLHYDVRGHLGDGSQSSLAFALDWLTFPENRPLTALALVGLASAVVRRRMEPAIVAVGAIAYCVVISSPKVHFERNLVPLWPLLAILAAEGVAWLGQLVCALLRRVGGVFTPSRSRYAAAGLLAVVVLLCAAPAFQRTASLDWYRSQPDVRAVTSEWIDTHLPAGSRIAVEPYSAAPDPQRFHVDYERSGLTAEPLAWYPANGVDYVVTSSMFNYRFLLPGAPYPADRAEYEAMSAQWTVVRTFVGTDTVSGGPGATLTLIRVGRG